MKKRGFGELELAVLATLKSGKRMTVKEVHHHLGSSNKYTTIMTVLLRLANKKILGRERVGAHYEYWLLSPIQETSSFIEKIKRTIIGMKPVELVSYLIDKDISDEELLEMEKLVAKAKQERKK